MHRPTPTTRAAERALDVIERCVSTLHDLAAQSPAAAVETLAALQTGTPAAHAVAQLVRRVAEARHGEWALRD